MGLAVADAAFGSVLTGEIAVRDAARFFVSEEGYDLFAVE